MKKILLIGLALGLFVVHSASASVINWTDWQSATPGAPDTVTGSMGSVGVTYTGLYSFVQLGTGTNYWTEPSVGQEPYTGNPVIDNAPTASEMIALNLSGSHTILFSAPVLNPIMAFVSMGAPDSAVTTLNPVTYNFDQSFNLLSNGVGYWSWVNGNVPGSATPNLNSLTGIEFHGAIQFLGSLSSISWSSPQNEDWHGFTVGVPGSPVPEPATMLLFGTGIIGLAGAVRRRRKQ